MPTIARASTQRGHRVPTLPLILATPMSDFLYRHIGPNREEQMDMLAHVGANSLEDLLAKVVPPSIVGSKPLAMPPALSEVEALAELRGIANKNQVLKNFIGQGYVGTVTPGVIQRNILENPAWYTAYTPYQPEISQGRLEAILNYQTMICDLTGMDISNASLLDEGTAAAEAMTLAQRQAKSQSKVFIVAGDCHPQTIECVKTRAEPLGIEVIVGFAPTLMEESDYFGTGAIPVDDRSHSRHEAVGRSRARERRIVHLRCRPVSSGIAQSPRRMGRRHRDWHLATIRRAHGLRWSARSVHGHARRIQAQHARPPCWRERGCARQARVPPHIANARATHSPRKSDQQHLHRTGVARGDSEHVRGVSRAAGIETDC